MYKRTGFQLVTDSLAPKQIANSIYAPAIIDDDLAELLEIALGDKKSIRLL